MSQDRQLEEAVLAEFFWDPAITAADLGVTADDGVVTLSGHVPSYLEKSATEHAAARVRGVKAVAQQIIVSLPVQTGRSDEDIAHAAIERIAWDVAIPADAITIKVEQGAISLSGEVAWHYQKDAAEKALHSLRGVVGITNLITIRPHLNVADIASHIEIALHRAWFDRANIRVSADGGAITLDGVVHNPAEKHMATTTAWAAPGATEVFNNLVMTG